MLTNTDIDVHHWFGVPSDGVERHWLPFMPPGLLGEVNRLKLTIDYVTGESDLSGAVAA